MAGGGQTVAAITAGPRRDRTQTVPLRQSGSQVISAERRSRAAITSGMMSPWLQSTEPWGRLSIKSSAP